MQRIFIRLRMNRYRFDAKLMTSSDNTKSDLSTVSYKNFLEWH
jgi:hypothetical protein